MCDLFFPLKIQKAEQIQSGGNAVGGTLGTQPFGLQRKLHLTCLLCTKSGPDGAHFLKIFGPVHEGDESSKAIMTSHQI